MLGTRAGLAPSTGLELGVDVVRRGKVSQDVDGRHEDGHDNGVT